MRIHGVQHECRRRPVDLRSVLVRLNKLDAELRDKHTGKPAEDIKPLALFALRRIGVSLPDAELVAYAEAVSRGEKSVHVS